MNEDFFDWLEDCPTNWVLNCEDSESREYIFFDNDDDEDTKHDNEEHDYKLEQEQARKENE